MGRILDLVPFDHLAGVRVHWGWDQPGRRKLNREFLRVLESALADLWYWHPDGIPELILSGGAYVPPPHPPRHCWGTAFDLSGFMWAGKKWELATAWRDNPRQSLAIEAVLRKSHSQVLGPWYNRDHRSHWHIDDGGAHGFQSHSRADVTFLQACLNHFWEFKTAIDGRYGPNTRTAAVEALQSIQQPPSIVMGWGAFLEAVWRFGFGRVEGVPGLDQL